MRLVNKEDSYLTKEYQDGFIAGNNNAIENIKKMIYELNNYDIVGGRGRLVIDPDVFESELVKLLR